MLCYDLLFYFYVIIIIDYALHCYSILIIYHQEKKINKLINIKIYIIISYMKNILL